MKSVMKLLGIIVLSALTAAAVIFAWEKCPKHQAEKDAHVTELVHKYISTHPNQILEVVAKSENFGNTIKNFANIDDEKLKQKINDILESNQHMLEVYVDNNTDAIAQKIVESGKLELPQKSEEVKVEPENNPNQVYIDHWDELKNHKAMPFVGPENAKVTVVEFYDFACGHCKALAPIMERLIKSNPDVKFVFAPLYFMSPHSPYAAKAALAAHKKGKFLGVYEGLLTLPTLDEKSIEQILTDEGLNVDEIKKMAEEKEIRRGIQDIDSLSQVLGINGVPVLLINGENFYGRSLEDLQNKLNSLK